MSIAAIFRGDRFRLVSGKSSINPGNSSRKGRHKKKIRGLDLFRSEKPGKTQFPDVQKRLKVHVSGRKTAPNGAKERVCCCSGSGPDGGGRRDIPGVVPAWVEVNSTSTDFRAPDRAATIVPAVPGPTGEPR
jgi:hypothetical protein